VAYQWLLLDADNTLFDYDAAEAQALAATFAAFDLAFAPPHAAAYREINDAIWQAFERGEIAQEVLRVERFRRLFAALGVETDPAAFSARYLEHLGQAANLVPGAETVLRALHGRVELALITNGIAAVQRSRLACSGLDRYLDAVLISEEIGASKPDRAIFDAAFAAMGHPSQEAVLIVGDSLTSDMAGGAAYGIDTCWFNPHDKPRNPDVAIRYEIRRLDALLGILDAEQQRSQP